MPRSARCGCCSRSSKSEGITGKRWTSASGRSWGGKPIARGALYLMLQNRIYRGEIVHKDQTYPGEHQAIIDAALWDTVQARLAENAVEREHRHSGEEPEPARRVAVRRRRASA